MYFLVILVDRIDHAALRIACQRDSVTFFVCCKLEFPAAEGYFFVAFLVVQWFKGKIGTGIAAVADTGVNDKWRLTLGNIKQRFGNVVIHQRRFHGGHSRNQIQ
ncbi:hypothetical protein SDC9_208771 [bioreactor metagenome]|uniref:Uncharacterized protein n=1 Tax=bioreactor metagenome TaxID=1076179 RepID=A0A645JCH8_9ZZZZ